MTAVCAGWLANVRAQTYLTGELSGSYPASEYIITGNIHVLPDSTLEFARGTVLYFEPFTGVVVRGTFRCIGTENEPVTFTSSKEREGRAAGQAFDWGGIKVEREAKSICISNARLSFSTFGIDIVSDSTEARLENVVWQQNGYSNLSRGGTFVQGSLDTAGSYYWRGFARAVEVAEAEPAPSASQTVSKEPPAAKERNWSLPVRIALGVVGLSAAVVSGYAFYKSEYYYEKYDSSRDPAVFSPSQVAGYRRKSERHQIYAWVGMGIALAGGSGIGVSFALRR